MYQLPSASVLACVATMPIFCALVATRSNAKFGVALLMKYYSFPSLQEIGKLTLYQANMLLRRIADVEESLGRGPFDSLCNEPVESVRSTNDVRGMAGACGMKFQE